MYVLYKIVIVSSIFSVLGQPIILKASQVSTAWGVGGGGYNKVQ